MYNIIPLLIILLSLGVIAYILIRKFPQLTNLDVNNLTQEKELRKKKEIISRRIEEQGSELKKRIFYLLGPLGKLWGKLQLQFRIYVGKVEKLWYHEETMRKKQDKVISPRQSDKNTKIGQILMEAENSLRTENLDKAEELYIAAIKLNVKSKEAYRGLGDTYFAKGAYSEATETYKFLLHLDAKDDKVMVKLAEIAEAQGKIEEAIEYYQMAVLINDSLSPRFFHLAELLARIKQPQVAMEAIVQAVELEPKNPKYLDLLIEIAILCGDKTLAQNGYNELRLVNPDNQKLAEFKEKISRIYK